MVPSTRPQHQANRWKEATLFDEARIDSIREGLFNPTQPFMAESITYKKTSLFNRQAAYLNRLPFAGPLLNLFLAELSGEQFGGFAALME